MDREVRAERCKRSNPAAETFQWRISASARRVSEEGSSSLKRRNLRCGSEAAAYIARCPAHSGGLHSHRLAHRRRCAIGSFL